MTLMCVRLELAGSSAGTGSNTGGDPGDAYEFLVSMASDDRIGLAAWYGAAPCCALRSHLPDGTVLYGKLIRTGRGEWAFS